MDPKFHPAIAAILGGDLDELSSLISNDPSLATARSSCSHPTLLQCLTLDAINVPNKVGMAKVLVEAGAEVNGPLVAAASMDNVEVAAALLDAGAALDGTGNWSPLEEALYWGQHDTAKLLLERGASVNNLRTAAGLGRVDLIERFFDGDNSLRPEAGKVSWPFGDLKMKRTEQLGWRHTRQDIVNNAFVYACMHNEIEAARLLLEKGAELNTIPPGFDYAGTGLHHAAVNGHREMVAFLIQNGADPTIKDTKVGGTPSEWADHGGHSELKKYLDGLLSN